LLVIKGFRSTIGAIGAPLNDHVKHFFRHDWVVHEKIKNCSREEHNESSYQHIVQMRRKVTNMHDITLLRCFLRRQQRAHPTVNPFPIDAKASLYAASNIITERATRCFYF